MSEAGRSYLFDSRARGDWVRLRTLVVLRWVAIIGQSVAVLTASELLEFRLPLAQCAMLISISVMVNVIAILMFPVEKRLTERGTLVSLFFDLAQLVALLMVTGGLNNPFALLILAPVTISATALRLQSTLLLGIAAMGLVIVMANVYLPLIQADGTPMLVPETYRAGIAAALAIGVVFLSLYARRVTVEGYAMSQALNATQIALAREQRLAAIGGLAAAAAHELGTPLATIKLVAGELRRDLADQPDLAEDAALIRAEAERCGQIMQDLSRQGRDDTHVKTAPIGAVLEEAAAPHAGRGKVIVIRINGETAEAAGDAQPSITRTPEFIHGMRNLVQNAVDFAETAVWIDVIHQEGPLRITVGDDGPGFSPELIPRLGEPYVSTRARGQRRAEDGEYEGMGLVLFITRTLMERTGARVSFANGTDQHGRRRRRRQSLPVEAARPTGALVQLSWEDIDPRVGKAETRRALGPNPSQPMGMPL